MIRGNIYFINMPRYDTTAQHSCEQGHRPVVVVSSNAGNRTSSIAMVCPITTKNKQLSCNVDIGWNVNGGKSQVLCNQITTVPRAILTDCVGHLNKEEMCRIDIALLISLGIKVNYNEVKY